ncbi:MAG: hypothetical protein ACYSUK_05225 [Planctomycetota bacterium]|jgi:hypothetical protein
MNKSLMYVIIFVAICIAYPFSAVLGQTSLDSGEDKLLSIVPSDALFVLRVNQFETTFNQLDQFLAGTSPLGLSMLVRMQLEGFLGDPALSNVNMKGNFAVFAIENPNPTAEDPMVPPVALMGCIPITDAEAFVEENPNCSEPDENGIATITTKDMMGNDVQMLITDIESYGLVCTKDCYEILSNFRKYFDTESGSGVKFVPIVEVLNDIEVQKAENEPIWLYMHLPEVSDPFISSISQQFEMMKMMMPQQQIPGIESSEENNGLIEILKSFQYISGVLVPSDTHCIFEAAIATKADSVLAPWFDPEGQAIQQMLQAINAQGPDQDPENLKQVTTFISDAQEMSYIGKYDLLNLFKLAAAMSPEPAEMELVSKSSLFYSIRFDKDLMNVKIAMPKEHLTEVVTASMFMQPQFSQMQMGQMPTMPAAGDINIPGSFVDAVQSEQPVSISETVTTPQPISESEPIVDVNGLLFGMTEETMTEILGPPKSTTGNVYYYFDTGLTIATTRNGQVDQIICGSVNPQSPLVSVCNYKTRDNVGIGSTRQELIEAYGQPSSVVNNPLGENAVMLEYENINARFTLVNDKIVQMIFRAPEN